MIGCIPVGHGLTIGFANCTLLSKVVGVGENVVVGVQVLVVHVFPNVVGAAPSGSGGLFVTTTVDLRYP